jgi:rhamnulokinase
MTTSKNRDFTFLAFDLGAESGRAIAGRLRAGKLSIEEIRRFPNQPIHSAGGMHWDAPRLWSEMKSALHSLAMHEITRLDSIGVDTWGVDYALLGENGALLESPYHYRDARTAGVMERVMSELTPEYIYGITGIQFLPFNTLYQLCAAAQQSPDILRSAKCLLTMPDLFNYWMTGKIVCEYTNASTTQFLDVHKRKWSTEILEKLRIPTHMLAPLINPGEVIGPLLPEFAKLSALSATQVIAPACHDTGSAFAAVHSGEKIALISSGTWSLLGTEMQNPVVTEEARRLNFTNEGGVCGTARLQKNITGMWLLERCRHAWKNQGKEYSYSDLLAMAAAEPALQHLVDPDDLAFTLPDDMPRAIAAFCARTGQQAPANAGAFTRAVLESLALKYRYVLELLESLTGTKFEIVRIVGGGSQNDMLNQFAANATGCQVLAGPSEATALGNLSMQMVGIGAVASLHQARGIVAESFSPRKFEPNDTARWQQAYGSFRKLVTK